MKMREPLPGMSWDIFEHYVRIESPGRLFDWLRENKPEPWSSEFELWSRAGAELSLLDRDDDLINLGLALYGTDPIVAEKLWLRSDNHLNQALLSGSMALRSWRHNKYTEWLPQVIPELFEEWSSELLRALMSNKYIGYRYLADLYRKEGIFENLLNDHWVDLVGFSSENHLMRIAPDELETIELPPAFVSSQAQAFDAAWDLLASGQEGVNAAYSFSSLVKNLPRVYSKDCYPVKSIMSRWRDVQRIDARHDRGYKDASYTIVLALEDLWKAYDRSDVINDPFSSFT